MSGMSEHSKEGQRGQLKSQVGFQAASAAVAVVAPTEQDRSEGMPSYSEAPNERGKSPLVTLGLFQSDSP